MCLITKDPALQEAKEDICCYKVLLFSKINPREIITPVMRTPITLNKLAIAEGAPEIRKGSGYLAGINEIEGGVIHCYEDLDQAAKFKLFIKANEGDFHQIIIVNATIPKGTLYTTGINGDICATQVFITNKIVLM